MPINAIRFKSLTDVTNTPTADLTGVSSNDILNAPVSSANETVSTEDVKALLNKADEKISDVLKKVKEGKGDFDKSVRDAKGLFSKVKDISGIPTKEIDKTISGVFKGNSSLASIFSSGVTKGCKDSMGSYKGLGKPYDLKVDCGGGKKKSTSRCNNGSFSDVINKLTNGAYAGTMSDLNSSLQSLFNLSMYGYDLNMCGVFGALGGTITDKNVLNRGAAGVLNALNGSKNTLGYMDLAGATAGLSPLSELPDGIAGALKNFKIPSDIKESSYSSFASRMDAASELFSDKYLRSVQDGTLSIADASYGTSEDYRLALKARLTDTTVNENNLDFVDVRDDLFTSSAFMTQEDFFV